MALPDFGHIISSGPEITFKSAGGSAAITMTSVANNAARQSVKADFGAIRARRYRLIAEVEMAATPTSGNVISFYLVPSASATAGTDNPGGAVGTDSAYAGYSSNLDASVEQLQYLGDMKMTVQATTTVQRAHVADVQIPLRYGALVVYNKAGSAFHSAATNVAFRFIPLEDSIDDPALA